MDRYRKAQAAERVLFTLLVALLGGAGFLYERFRHEVPEWRLVGWLSAYMCASYVMYRIALKVMRRKL